MKVYRKKFSIHFGIL